MIRTGGGAFKPAERPKYFAAGSHIDEADMPNVLVATNDLFTAGEEATLARMIDEGRNVLLDSGIFWLTNQYMKTAGITMDQALGLAPEKIPGFEELFDRYVQLVQRYGDRLWGYIELDQGGMVNKRRTRTRLHDLGLTPMPVYHPLNDGWDYFDELASTHDRMCMGNVVQAHSGVRMRLLHTLWERHLAYPDLWVHVLGLSANPHCLATPPDSCDSSTWIAGFRWKVITESAMLRPLGRMGNEFHYSTGQDFNAKGGRNVTPHIKTYGEGMIHMNSMWTDILGVQKVLGAPWYPEGEPAPRKPITAGRKP